MKESDFIIEDIINDYQVSEYQTYGVYEAIIHKTDEFAYVSFFRHWWLFDFGGCSNLFCFLFQLS